MSGTVEGGYQAAQTNKQTYGADFFEVIGAKGGSKSRGGGFAQGEIGRERARLYGRLGGSMGSPTGRKLSDSQKARIKARFYKQYEQNLARLTKIHEAAMAAKRRA